jgi:hypothetical protein
MTALPRDAISGSRLGVIADLHHHPGRGPTLPDSVLAAFRGVDAVVALGDMGEAAALDRLATLAPLLGTRGMDDPADDPRLVAGARLFEVGGLLLGAVFDLSPGTGIRTQGGLAFPEAPASKALRRLFPERLDAVLYAATHEAQLARHDGVLFVNPGSPTLAERHTVAIVSVADGEARAEIVEV